MRGKLALAAGAIAIAFLALYFARPGATSSATAATEGATAASTEGSGYSLIPEGLPPAAAAAENVREMMARAAVGPVFIAPYPWNAKEWTGVVQVAYDGREVTASVNMSYTAKFNPYAPVLGYPSVRYGCDPLFYYCSGRAQPLELPEPASKAGGVLVLSYSVSPGDCNVTDFSYDIWFNRGGFRLGAGDLELMLWLYYNVDPSASLPAPYWRYLGERQLRIAVDGAWQTAEASAYVHLSQGSWSVLVFVLRRPVQSGTVAVDLGQLVRAAQAALNGTPIDLERLNLTSIDVGMEFDGPPGVRLTCSYAIYGWSAEP